MAPNAKLAEKSEKRLWRKPLEEYQAIWGHQLPLMRIRSPCQALDELAALMRGPPGYTAPCGHWPALAVGYVAAR